MPKRYQYTTISIMPYTKNRFLRIISPILKIYKHNIWENIVIRLCDWIETSNLMIEKLYVLKDKGLLTQFKESLPESATDDRKAICDIEKALGVLSKIRVSEEE